MTAQPVTLLDAQPIRLLRHEEATMSAPTPAAGSPSSRRWLALGLIATAQFMVIMDTSIIGVALPEMKHDLGLHRRASRLSLLAGFAEITSVELVGRAMQGAGSALIARFGPKAMTVTGLATLAVGLASLSSNRADGSFPVDVLPATPVTAAGMAMAFIPSLGLALSSAAPEKAGLASGIANTNYQIGPALGLAAMTAMATAFGADRSPTSPG